MRRFCLFVILVIMSIGAALWAGGQPERRYESADCQYRMVYGYQPEEEIGLVTLGGSRLRVSTNARHFNEVLAAHHPNAAQVHNLSHSYYSIGKEYVLLRDFLEQHRPKSFVVMIEPRSDMFGNPHPDFVEIARFRDVPLILSAFWPENPLNALRAVRDTLFQHLAFAKRVGEPHRETTVYDCDQRDFRLNVLALDEAERQFASVRQSVLHWDFNAPEEEGFRRWMEAYRELAAGTSTEIMFLLITGTSEPLPPRDLESRFEGQFGMPLIIMDRELHAALAYRGNRDNHHMDRPGREIFLPWLINRIDEKCGREDGCF